MDPGSSNLCCLRVICVSQQNGGAEGMLPGRGWESVSPGSEFQDHHWRWGAQSGESLEEKHFSLRSPNAWALLSWELRGWPKLKESSSTLFPDNPKSPLTYTKQLAPWSSIVKGHEMATHSFLKSEVLREKQQQLDLRNHLIKQKIWTTCSTEECPAWVE